MSDNRKELTVIVAILLLTGLLFGLTNPNILPLAFTLLPHFLLFTMIYLGAKLVFKNTVLKNNHSVVRGLSLSIAALPVLLIVLQSMGQLTPRDVLIVFALIGLLIFYFRQTNF